MIKLLPDERQSVAQYIHSICAITLDPSKDYLIESRLNHLLEEMQCPSFTHLVNRSRIDASGAIQRAIIDRITTGETLFFRDTAPFDLLRFKIIPELLDRRARSRVNAPIRIWSAACSTGQELYSIAILLKEMLGADLPRHNVRLLGTDISDQAVLRASAGVFGEIEIGRGLTHAARDKSFSSHPGGWKIRDELRAMVSFRKLNLMDDFSALGKFDVVFCRNVAIYFNDRDRISLFNRIEQSMEKDACLVVGSMESLTAICPRFVAQRHLRSVFYQR